MITHYVCYVIKCYYCCKKNLQAAWIIDDSDDDYPDSDEDGADGMVVEDAEACSSDQKVENGFELDEDQASLNLRDSDEETDLDSSMMVNI